MPGKDRASLRLLVERAEEMLKKKAEEKDNPSNTESEQPKVVPRTRAKKRKAEEEPVQVELTKEKMDELELDFAHFIASSTISLTCVENPRMSKWLKGLHPHVSLLKQ